MSCKNGKEVLYLVWKDPESRRNFTVGQLIREDGFRFQYIKEYQQAKQYGWGLLEAFPEDKVYESEQLFPVFSSRLPDPKRRDMQSILRKYGLTEYDGFALLQKNGGKLPIDTYEFIDPIFMEDEKIAREFFVMGIRHVTSCGGTDCQLLPKVSEGEELILVRQPDNQQDAYAVCVMTQANEHLGYVPRYYSQVVYQRMAAGETYTCRIQEINRSQSCSDCVKVLLTMPSTKK